MATTSRASGPIRGRSATREPLRPAVFYSEEDGGYIADIPDLASCSAFGETAEAAVRAVEEAKIAWLEAASDLGRRIPEPRRRLSTG